MMPWQMDSPSPVPSPTGLVVKNGSKTRESTSGAMPMPVSVTSTTTWLGSRAQVVTDDVVLLGALALGDGLRRVDQQVEEHLAQPGLVGLTPAARLP